MRKAWRKSLHKRKVWKKISVLGRMVYYMQPLLSDLQDIWLEPLPFPTLLKLAYSCLLCFVILLPLLFPLLVALFYFGIFQYVAEQHSWLSFDQNWDLLGAMSNLWNFEVTNKKYQLYLHMCLDRYRTIIIGISTTLDYMRMALFFIFS
ncbi:uncharacterized protein DMAD_04151 [Drosophila madeirensis]|uniref:Uncharacterized protein n=1 Tax=Drosophila madeirensis TaxID=30013 RepID=A0AAU9G9Y7_DROMD